MKDLENISMKLPRYNYDVSEEINLIFSRLSPILNSFNNKRILITGGTGFFGLWLLQILCSLVHERGFNIGIYVISRNPERFLQEHSEILFEPYITFIQGDITNFKLPNIEIDYLIHMATTAAQETFAGEDQLNKLDLLYRGTRNTLENAVAKGVKKVLFTSSGVVYGPSDGKFLSEEMLQAPMTILESSALGEGKRIAEYLVAYYAKKAGYKYSIARCFSFFGPFLPLDIHYAIGNFVRDAIYTNEIIVNGSGKEFRSFLYIADAWIWLLMLLIESDNEIYNVGSSNAITIEELAKEVRNVLCPQKNVKILGLEHDVGNFNRSIYVPNNDKIIKKFNVHEWTNLKDGIKRMACLKNI
jgi:dTDP-glucose 4,6-dehydratase/UDP-glucose 4-epimerase